MIPVQVSLNHKKVLIIGGGKVGLRKAKLFLSEGACVYVLSHSIEEELKQYNIHWIQKNYESNDIDGYFLVYACTDDKDVNHKIVDDCNKHNILCGSATYDDESSFYSMGYISRDVGTLALSMNQCLPYHKPLLNKMMKVLDDNEMRIKKLLELRPFVLQYAKNKKRYFELLFECDEKIVDFLMNVFLSHKGYIFVYHGSEIEDCIDISYSHSIVLTIDELMCYRELFEDIDVVIVPLVLSEGYIYNKIKNILPNHKYTLPLLNKEDDIKSFIDMYESETKDMIYIVHPCSNHYLKETLKKNVRNDDQVIEFDEEVILSKDKSYRCVVLLISHGTHFLELRDLFDFKIQEGYNIEYIGCLSDSESFKEFVIKKIY